MSARDLPQLHVTIDEESIRRAMDAKFNSWGGLQNIICESDGIRGAEANAIIARVQKAAGRNPWYVSPEGWTKLSQVIKRYMASPNYPNNRKQMLEHMCNVLVEDIQSNFRKQRNPDGSSFTPLDPVYAQKKIRDVGAKPILERIGDLMKNVKARPTDLIK